MAVAKKLTAIEFYESVKKTNPDYVKNQNAGGRKISTIDPQYQTENATKAFNGLYGASWGIKDIEFTTRMYGTTEVMNLKGVFFYPDGEFPYSVSDKSFYVSRGGNDIIDTDIEKKLLTSFKSKCLSLLGFNADIFMGEFDNAAYVQAVGEELSLITYGQFQEIAKLMQDTDTDATQFNNAFGIDKTMELPLSEFNKALAMLNAKKAKIAKKAKENKNEDIQ